MFAEGLRCVECQLETDLGGHFFGCRECGGALETVYDEARVGANVTFDEWRRRDDRSMWRYRELLPVAEESAVISLGEGRTPLVRLPESANNPLSGLWVQNETVNPTYSFKDRFHSAAQSMARQLGYDRIACSTTGNHGMSAAAYAARGGLRCVVLVDPRAPVVQRQWMSLFGATVIVEMNRQAPLENFVRNHGWYPSTYMTPNPGGHALRHGGLQDDGLRRHACARVRSRSLHRSHRGGGRPLRTLEGVRGDGSPGLDRFDPPDARRPAGGGQRHRPVLPGRVGHRPLHQGSRDHRPFDRGSNGGAMTLRAIRESGGQAIDISDEDIVAATRYAAGMGLSTEPSSAASLAGAWALARDGTIASHETVVCLVTGAGCKWPETTELLVEEDEIVSPDPEWLERFASGS